MDLIGRVCSKKGEYRSREIEITLLDGKLCYSGQILAIKHPENPDKLIAFQAIDVPITLTGYEQYFRQIKSGEIPYVKDKEIFEVRARQLGYWEGGEIVQYLYPIEPMTEVYALSDEEASSFLEPRGFSIPIGKIYPSLTYPLKLDIKMLIRQGCLITGAVGTGKTTTLITMIHRLANCGWRIPFCIIDLGGELSTLARELGFFMMDLSGARAMRVPLSLQAFYKKAVGMSGASHSKSEVKALYAVLQRMKEEGKRQFEWSRKQWKEILEQLDDKASDFWLERVVIREEEEEEVDIISILKQESVWIDCKGFDWDTIVSRTSSILNALFRQASSDQNFGAVIIIDEIHNIAPQNPWQATASGDLYKKALPTIKKVATMGARNLVPIFATTQRLAEVHKAISTQLGMNMIAHQVEDVDLERLKEMVGRVAYIASQLSRGYALIKSRAIPIQGAVIVKIDKILEPASVAKDPKTVWGW